MKIKTLIIAALTLCALAFVPVVQAQGYFPTTALAGGTNNVAATTTNTSFAVILSSQGRGPYMAVQPSFKLIGAGTSAVVFKFDESVDGTIWDLAAHTISVTASTTNVVTTLAPITLGAIGYLRLTTIENPNATAITNLTLKYVTK